MTLRGVVGWLDETGSTSCLPAPRLASLNTILTSATHNTVNMSEGSNPEKPVGLLYAFHLQRLTQLARRKQAPSRQQQHASSTSTMTTTTAVL
jgi:hypothetical protein